VIGTDSGQCGKLHLRAPVLKLGGMLDIIPAEDSKTSLLTYCRFFMPSSPIIQDARIVGNCHFDDYDEMVGILHGTLPVELWCLRVLGDHGLLIAPVVGEEGWRRKGIYFSWPSYQDWYRDAEIREITLI
jgi:hypothetical protein